MSDNQMTLVELHSTFQKLVPGEVILDVRGKDEFSAGHIPKAMNIPVSEVAQRSSELKSFKKIYVHCKRGGTGRKRLLNL